MRLIFRLRLRLDLMLRSKHADIKQFLSTIINPEMSNSLCLISSLFLSLHLKTKTISVIVVVETETALSSLYFDPTKV